MAWHYRRELLRTVRGTFGHDEMVMHAHIALEPSIDMLWSVGDHDLRWYDTPMYAYSCVNCFCDYSKAYAHTFGDWVNAHPELGIERVLDVGCGIGATSRLFAELTGKEVLAHAYYRGVQSRVADIVVADETRVIPVESIRPTMADFMSYQAVMMFELLEHVEDPVLEFKMFASKPDVVAICESSSFHIDNYGHWPVYDGGVPRAEMSRLFAKKAREWGWEVVHSGWNNRPRVWMRR